MNEHINLQTLPVSWFPDLEAVKAFIEGPRYEALRSLAFGANSVQLPEPLATEAITAGAFVADDLLELGRYAALSNTETFEAPREDGDWSSEWPKWLSMLGAVALAGNFVERIFEPLLEMMAEEEVAQEALRKAKAEAEFRAMKARRAKEAEGERT